MLADLTHNDFQTHLNSHFTVHYDRSETLELELMAVDTIGNQPVAEEASRWPFSLLFRSPNMDKYLVQGQYPISHAALGDFILFIVPLGPGADGMEYEAVFT